MLRQYCNFGREVVTALGMHSSAWIDQDNFPNCSLEPPIRAITARSATCTRAHLCVGSKHSNVMLQQFAARF